MTGTQAAESFIFFTIFDVAANALVFDAVFLPPRTSGITIPAGTLQSAQSHICELIFSNPRPGA